MLPFRCPLISRLPLIGVGILEPLSSHPLNPWGPVRTWRTNECGVCCGSERYVSLAYITLGQLGVVIECN